MSTTQAVVGAIVGWNWFTGSITDLTALTKIVSTWVAAPILGGLFGAGLYVLTVFIIHRASIHLLSLDMYTRIALVLAGAFGSYSLGANNIGNVMGVPTVIVDFGDRVRALTLTLRDDQRDPVEQVSLVRRACLDRRL